MSERLHSDAGDPENSRVFREDGLCEVHPGEHTVTKRAAGYVYLSCGCFRLESDPEEEPPA